jgi:hypothetical protein
MTARHLAGTLATGLLAWTVAAFTPAVAQAQNESALPAGGQKVILIGCLQNPSGDEDGFVLMNAMQGPATTVPDGSCTGAESGSGVTVELERTKEHLDTSLTGRWVEIVGKLENNRRELHLMGARAIPVSAPIAVLIVPQPQPQAEAPAPPEETPAPPEQPIATTGQEPAPAPVVQKPLPKTASPVPLVGAIGLLSLGSALVLAFGRRRGLVRG